MSKPAKKRDPRQDPQAGDEFRFPGGYRISVVGRDGEKVQYWRKGPQGDMLRSQTIEEFRAWSGQAKVIGRSAPEGECVIIGALACNCVGCGQYQDGNVHTLGMRLLCETCCPGPHDGKGKGK